MRSGFFSNTFLTAEDFAHCFGGAFTSGVLALTDEPDALAVTAGTSGMSFAVAAGYCWINGRFGQAESTESVTLSVGDGTNPRKDRIVARLDLEEKSISLAVIAGTPAASPTAPDIVRNSTVYDLGLAVIDVPRGAISAGECTVTDTRRDTSVCGGAFPQMSGAFVWPSANLIGEIRIYAGETAPERWLFCRGQSLNKSEYEDLFTVIGYTYGGSGDNFNLPDMQLRFPRGVAESGTTAETTLGRTGGSSSATLTTAQLPAHTHTLSGSSGTTVSKLTLKEASQVTSGAVHASGAGTGEQRYLVEDVTVGGGGSGSTGSTGAENPTISILNKFINVNYIIYTGVIAP